MRPKNSLNESAGIFQPKLMRGRFFFLGAASHFVVGFVFEVRREDFGEEGY